MQSGRIRVIHHGTPDLPATDASRVKRELGLSGRTTILSFGLLGPGKGYEHMIEAVAALSGKHPDVLYVVLGATHPDVLRSEGERYRDRLENLVVDLGIHDHVRFVNKYVGQAELGRWLQAADIFTTPYPNLEQAVSGTLSYAVAAGKAIVSTPYAYARELLAHGRGLIVESDAAAALAAGLDLLVGNEATPGRDATQRIRLRPPHDLAERRSRVPRSVRSGSRRRGPHSPDGHRSPKPVRGLRRKPWLGPPRAPSRSRRSTRRTAST